MERPKKNFSDEIFPHCVWEKKLTGPTLNTIITALFLLSKLIGEGNVNEPIEFSVIAMIGIAFLINIILRFRK